MNLTQMRLRISAELNGAYVGTALNVDVPQQMLVDLLAEPFLRDANNRAMTAEENAKHWRSAYMELKKRSLWRRVLNLD